MLTSNVRPAHPPPAEPSPTHERPLFSMALPPTSSASNSAAPSGAASMMGSPPYSTLPQLWASGRLPGGQVPSSSSSSAHPHFADGSSAGASYNPNTSTILGQSGLFVLSPEQAQRSQSAVSSAMMSPMSGVLETSSLTGSFAGPSMAGAGAEGNQQQQHNQHHQHRRRMMHQRAALMSGTPLSMEIGKIGMTSHPLAGTADAIASPVARRVGADFPTPTAAASHHHAAGGVLTPAPPQKPKLSHADLARAGQTITYDDDTGLVGSSTGQVMNLLVSVVTPAGCITEGEILESLQKGNSYRVRCAYPDSVLKTKSAGAAKRFMRGEPRFRKAAKEKNSDGSTIEKHGEGDDDDVDDNDSLTNKNTGGGGGGGNNEVSIARKKQKQQQQEEERRTETQREEQEDEMAGLADNNSAVIRSVTPDGYTKQDVQLQTQTERNTTRRFFTAEFKRRDVLPFGFHSPSAIFNKIGRHTNLGMVVGWDVTFFTYQLERRVAIQPAGGGAASSGRRDFHGYQKQMYQIQTLSATLAELQLPPSLTRGDPTASFRVGSVVECRRFGEFDLDEGVVVSVARDVTYTIKFKRDDAVQDGILHSDIRLINANRAERVGVRDRVLVGLMGAKRATVIQCYADGRFQVVTDECEQLLLGDSNVLSVRPPIQEAVGASKKLTDLFDLLDEGFNASVSWLKLRRELAAPGKWVRSILARLDSSNPEGFYEGAGGGGGGGGGGSPPSETKWPGHRQNSVDRHQRQRVSSLDSLGDSPAVSRRQSIALGNYVAPSNQPLRPISQARARLAHHRHSLSWKDAPSPVMRDAHLMTPPVRDTLVDSGAGGSGPDFFYQQQQQFRSARIGSVLTSGGLEVVAPTAARLVPSPTPSGSTPAEKGGTSSPQSSTVTPSRKRHFSSSSQQTGSSPEMPQQPPGSSTAGAVPGSSTSVGAGGGGARKESLITWMIASGGLSDRKDSVDSGGDASGGSGGDAASGGSLSTAANSPSASHTTPPVFNEEIFNASSSSHPAERLPRSESYMHDKRFSALSYESLVLGRKPSLFCGAEGGDDGSGEGVDRQQQQLAALHGARNSSIIGGGGGGHHTFSSSNNNAIVSPRSSIGSAHMINNKPNLVSVISAIRHRDVDGARFEKEMQRQECLHDEVGDALDQAFEEVHACKGVPSNAFHSGHDMHMSFTEFVFIVGKVERGLET